MLFYEKNRVELSKDEQEIIEFLKVYELQTKQSINHVQVARYTGIPPYRTQKALHKLFKKNIVRRSLLQSLPEYRVFLT